MKKAICYLLTELVCTDTDPNRASYVDPNYFERWDSRCNLDTAGSSLYMIDLADLQMFLEDSPWLWWACWRMDIWIAIEQQAQQSMMLQSILEGSNRMASVGTAAASASEPISEMNRGAANDRREVDGAATTLPAETLDVFDPVVEQATILSLIEDIQVFINADGEDAAAWLEMKNLLEQSLVDIEDMINGDAEI